MRQLLGADPSTDQDEVTKGYVDSTRQASFSFEHPTEDFVAEFGHCYLLDLWTAGGSIELPMADVASGWVLIQNPLSDEDGQIVRVFGGNDDGWDNPGNFHIPPNGTALFIADGLSDPDTDPKTPGTWLAIIDNTATTVDFSYLTNLLLVYSQKTFSQTVNSDQTIDLDSGGGALGYQVDTSDGDVTLTLPAIYGQPSDDEARSITNAGSLFVRHLNPTGTHKVIINAATLTAPDDPSTSQDFINQADHSIELTAGASVVLIPSPIDVVFDSTSDPDFTFQLGCWTALRMPYSGDDGEVYSPVVPSSDTMLANKAYVDSGDANAMPKWEISSPITDFTAEFHHAYVVTSGHVITLPASSEEGGWIYFFNTESSTAVTIAADGSDGINPNFASTFTLNAKSSVFLFSDGLGTWYAALSPSNNDFVDAAALATALEGQAFASFQTSDFTAFLKTAYEVDTSAGDVTVTLPPAGDASGFIAFEHTLPTGTHKITVNAYAGDTIGLSLSSFVLKAGASATLYAAGGGGNYWTLLKSPYSGDAGEVYSPSAPTSGTMLANKDYVDTADALKAPLASPALTGNPTAPTQTAGNNSTRVATTAYADAATGLRLKYQGAWTTSTAYAANDVVKDADVLWVCILGLTSTTHPAIDATHWTELGIQKAWLTDNWLPTLHSASGAMSMATHSFYLADVTSSGFSLTLPAANSAHSGESIVVRRAGTGFNALAIVRSGTDTIDGATTTPSLVGTDESIILYTDGVSAWSTVRSKAPANTITATTSATYSAPVTHSNVVVSSGDNVTLPSSPVNGQIVVVKNVGTLPITILSASATIEKALHSIDIAPSPHYLATNLWPAMTFMYDSTNTDWKIIGDYNPNSMIARSVDQDPWNYVEDDPASTPLGNSWKFYGSDTFSPVRYMRDAYGHVWIQGLITAGGVGTLFTLPPGYRPSATIQFIVQSSATDGCGIVSVASTGAVSVVSGGTGGLGNSFFSLANVQFFAEDFPGYTASSNKFTPTLQTGWSAKGGAYMTPRYFIDPDGWAWAYGSATGSGITPPSNLFVANFASHYPYVGARGSAYTTGSIVAQTRLDLSTVGQVTVSTGYIGTGSSTTVDLAGLKWRVTGGGTNGTPVTRRPRWRGGLASSAAGVPGTGWSNGWTEYGSGFAPVSWCKDSIGTVFLTGLVTGGTPTLPVFTLPPGFRPMYQTIFIVNSNTGTARVDVNPNGQVTVWSYNSNGSSAFSFLDPICFPADC